MNLDSLFDIDRKLQVSDIYKAQPGQSDVRVPWTMFAKKSGLTEPELLLPRIVQPCPLELPPFMRDQGRWADMKPAELQERVAQMRPWDFFYQLGHGVTTIDWPGVRERMLYRSHVITDTVEKLLGNDIGSCTVLDLACNAGYFAFDLASRGAKWASGIELREKSVRQAEFLTEYYGIKNVDFAVADVFAYEPPEQFDVVLNLGLFYHVTQPFELALKTFALCKRFAVFDGICHALPFPGFYALAGQDAGKPTNGKYSLEFVPTYRGLIDILYEAGFSNLVEVIGKADKPIQYYDQRIRRTIIAFKDQSIGALGAKAPAKAVL